MPYGGKGLKGSNPNLTQALRDNVTLEINMEDEKLYREYEQLQKQVEIQGQRLKKLKNEEQSLSVINRLNLFSKWRNKLRLDQVRKFQDEIDLFAQLFVKEINHKDVMINELIEELAEVESQFQTVHSHHINRKRQLLQIHRNRLIQLENEYNKDKNIIINDLENEKKIISSHLNQEIQELYNIVETIQLEENQRENEARHIHETQQEEIRNRDVEMVNRLRYELFSHILNLEDCFDQDYINYSKKTLDKNAQYNNLTITDNDLINKIKNYKISINDVSANFQYQKKKRAQNERECTTRNHQLKTEKDIMTRHYSHLKDKMNHFRQQEHIRLTNLSRLSRIATHANEKLINQAENLLKMAEYCRKYESTQEKILPYYQSTIIDESKLQDKIVDEKEKKQIGEEFEKLTNFHKKYNKVLLNKLQLIEEKKRIEEENKDLKSILNQYLEDSVLKKDNSLLVINGRTNLTQRPIRKILPEEMPKFVEGNQLVNNYIKQTK